MAPSTTIEVDRGTVSSVSEILQDREVREGGKEIP